MFAAREKPPLSKRLKEFFWPSMGIRRAWNYRMHRMARMDATPHALALGFATGAFASFTPFVGLHFIMALVVAYVLRGNLVTSAIGTVVGNPVTLPFIWIASYNVGAEMLGLSARDHVSLHTDPSVGLFSDGPIAFAQMLWTTVEPVIWPMVLGGLPLGLLCGAVCYVLVYGSLNRFRAGRVVRSSDQRSSTAS